MKADATEKVIAWLISGQLGEPIDPESFRNNLPAIASKLRARLHGPYSGLPLVGRTPSAATLREKIGDPPSAEALLDVLPLAVAFEYADLEKFILTRISLQLDDVLLALLDRM